MTRARSSMMLPLVALAAACGFAGVGEPLPTINNTPVSTPPEAPTRIVVLPAAPSIHLGDTLVLTATGLRANGSSIQEMTASLWTTGPATVGYVTATNGASTVYRSTGLGTATVFAMYAGITGSATVTVVP